MADWALRPVAVLVAGTLFMENLDGTIIATAAPSMARHFGVESAQVGVCVTAYLITVAALIPLSAWVADRWGIRSTFLAAISVFTLASALCSISTSLPILIGMRVLQGAGGSMMVPVGRLAVLGSTAKHDVIRAIAYLTWPALLAPVIAPTVGGLLTTYASWRWIFLINVPLGLAALIVAARIMPRLSAGELGPLDRAGFIGTALALGCLVSVAAVIGEPSVNWASALALTAVGVTSGSFAIVHLLRVPNPLIRLDALRVRTFRAAQTGGALFRIGINAVPFLLPLMFQDQFGWTPARAGLVMVFLFSGNVAIKPLTTPLLRTLPFRTVLVATTATAALTVGMCGLLRVSTAVPVIAVLLFASGNFRSIGYTCYNTIAFADIDQPAMNQANALATTIQQLTQALGVALAVVALKVGGAVVHAGHAYSFAFVVTAGVIALALIDAMLLPAGAGDSIRGSKIPANVWWAKRGVR